MMHRIHHKTIILHLFRYTETIDMKIRLTLILFIFCGSLMAQDHIGPLHSNPQLRIAYNKAMIANKKAVKRTTASHSSVTLPFLDDFAKPGPYPDTNWWLDSNVYVNYNLPYAPHTIGVATFDGLNKRGMPYNKYATAGSSLPADTLTSKKIQLGSYTLADSLYLSFYYQQGSRYSGDTNILFPKLSDTLLLQFHNPANPDTSDWVTVWYQVGSDTLTAKDSNFRYVMIPITNPFYLANGFQFRFVNYACTSGNLDHWSIDEVYLNDNRHITDTAQHGMSFVYEFPSLLANYEYMPWEQFTGASDLKTSFHNYIRNNNNIVINATYGYDAIPGFLTSYSGGGNNEPTYYSSGYVNYTPHSEPTLTYSTLPTLTAPTTFNFTEYLDVTGPFDSLVDTLRFAQVFDNYFAYDDGSPECAWFVSGTPGVPTYIAQEFTLNKTDTLVAALIYFDYTLVNAKVYSFNLAVWADNGGVPGTMIYEDTAARGASSIPNIDYPKYDSAGLNLFTPYNIDSAHGIILPPGKFYLGWVQSTENIGGDSINIGMDLNNNHADKIFYCTDPISPNWQNTTFPGSLMLRPVFGPRSYDAVPEITKDDNNVTIYPNPTTGVVNFQLKVDNEKVKMVEIYNTLGEKVYSSSNGYQLMANGEMQIDLSSLPTGFYIVKVSTDTHTAFKKLIIQR